MPAELENLDDWEPAFGPDDVPGKFEDFLVEVATDNELTLDDIDMIEVILHIRLRGLFTLDQLHQRAHGLIEKAEAILQQPGGLRDPETGLPVPPLLVENFKGNPEEYLQMISQSQQTITDDDLAGLFGEEEE